LEINIFGNVLDALSTDDFPDGPMFQRSTLQFAFVDTFGTSWLFPQLPSQTVLRFVQMDIHPSQ
jgi:hypothetical protein